MNIKFNFKNFDPSDHLKKYAQTRFEKIGKYLPNDENADLVINLEVEKHRHIAEAVLKADNLHLSGTEESEDMYTSIDLLLDKIESQVRKVRDKTKSRGKNARDKMVIHDIITFSEDESDKEPTIVESDKYEPKPMLVEEAAMQLNSLKYEFLVFLNAETERINVIYLRKNGDFGLIDPGA